MSDHVLKNQVAQDEVPFSCRRGKSGFATYKQAENHGKTKHSGLPVHTLMKGTMKDLEVIDDNCVQLSRDTVIAT